MSGAEKLDQVFHLIIKQMVKTGQAPHYTGIRRGGFRAFATQPGGMHRRLKCEVIFARGQGIQVPRFLNPI